MLALTSQGIAVARGASAASGQMVLCTGAGPMAVYVDDQGQPTSAPLLCSDAAFHDLVDVVLPQFGAPLRSVPFDPVLQIAPTPEPIFAWIAPPSRGPPFDVLNLVDIQATQRNTQ